MKKFWYQSFIITQCEVCSPRSFVPLDTIFFETSLEKFPFRVCCRNLNQALSAIVTYMIKRSTPTSFFFNYCDSWDTKVFCCVIKLSIAPRPNRCWKKRVKLDHSLAGRIRLSGLLERAVSIFNCVFNCNVRALLLSARRVSEPCSVGLDREEETAHGHVRCDDQMSWQRNRHYCVRLCFL
jgi:hypothetical protein